MYQAGEVQRDREEGREGEKIYVEDKKRHEAESNQNDQRQRH